MDAKVEQKRKRLLTDSEEHVSRYKLYKSGTKWVVAGVTTVMFTVGLASYVAPATAHASNTADFADATSTTAEANGLADQTHVISTASTTTTTTATGDTSTDAPKADTATTTDPASTTTSENTGLTTENDDNNRPSAADKTADSSTVTDATDTPTVTAVDTSTDKLTTEPDTTTDSNQATDESTSNSETTTDTTDTVNNEDETTTVDTPTITGSMADGGVMLPDGTFVSNRATTAKISAVNPTSIDITRYLKQYATNNPFQISGNPAWTFTKNGGYYINSANTGTGAPDALASFKNTTYPWAFTNYKVMATDTRTVNGEVQLTPTSKVTVTFNNQTLTISNLNALVSRLKSLTLSTNNNGTVTKSVSSAYYNPDGSTQASAAITAQGTPGFWNGGGTLSGLAIPATAITDSQTKLPTGNMTIMETVEIYSDTSRNNANFITMRLQLGNIKVSKQNLTPIVSARTVNAANTTTTSISGTGTGAGNTITLKNQAGKVLGTTTVKADGTWTLSATTLGASTDDIFAVESNTLGDTPGIALAPQHALVNRTVQYVNSDGTTAPATKTVAAVNFARTAKSAGTVAAPKATYNAWASSNNTAAAVVTTPVETGYVADLASVTPKAVALPTAANATTVATKVTYTPVGKYTFSGAPTAFTPVTYINNTTNATAVNNSSITITYVPGYTPSVAGVALTPVNASDLTQGYKAPTPVKATANTAIVYTANAAKATVTFIDDNAATPAQSTIQADTINGQTDGTMTYTTDATLAALTAKGYELVSDGYTTADTTAKVFDTTDDTNGVSQAFTVHMKHKIVTFTPDQPGTDDGVTETDLNHTVTITDHFGGPVNEDVTETPVTFTRSGTRDYVLKTVTYTPWTTTMADGTTQTNVTLSADDFSQLAADKTGDTGFVPADITATIDGLGVADSSKDIQFSGDVTNIVRNVTYVDSLMHITYVDVDDNNKVLKTLTPKYGSFTTDIASVTGMVTDPISGQQIYPLELVSTSSALSSENGQLTTDTNGLPAETFTGTGGGVYTIELKHVHSTDTATTTRTINYAIDDGAVTAPASVTQTANWTRDIDVYKQAVEQAAEKDATTYTLVKGYAAQTSPTIAEYVPDTATVAAETPAVTADNSLPANETVTVTYTQNVFTPAHPGAYADELTKTVTETVKYVDGMTGQPMFDIDPTTGASTTAIPDATPSVTFTRTRTNNADGTVTYSAYTPATQTITAVTSPVIATKVATIKEVPALAVTPTSTPATITVKYFPATIQVSPHDPAGPKQPGELINPNDPTGPTYPAGVTTSDLNETYTETVHFINDDDGTAVGPDHTDAVHYERTATIDYGNLDSAGNPTVTYSDWTLALNKDGSATSPSFASFAVPTDDNLVTVENANLKGGRYQEVPTDPTSTTMAITDTVHYTSAWQEVTPGDPIPDNTQVDDLSRTITEFVTYKDGVTGATLTSPTPITQTSTRTATYNTNTGQVIYTKWTTAKFAEITNPHTTTTADETDPSTGFTIPAGTDMYSLAKTINAVTADGASVEGQPTTTLADGTETYSLNYTVYYYPATVTLDPNNPDSPKDPNEQYDPKNPNGPVWPAAGLTYDDMHQTVNEVINYVDTDGNVVSTPVTNKVAYQRTATVTFNDDGTANTPTYGAWTLTPTADGQAGNATIPAVISPVLTSKNLIADQPVVSAFDTASTMIGTADQTTTKTVTYYPNSVTVNPNDPLTPGAQITPGTNDPRLVPNNGVSANDLTKTATETLRYLDGLTNEELQADATVATLTFQRTATITYGANYATDPTDYTITYSNWNPAAGSTNTFAEIDAGNALLPIVINGKLTTVNADYEDGVITPNSQKINALTETTPTDVSLAIYYYGDITITPDHPVIPGSPINPADPTSPLYPVEDSEVPVDPSNPDQPVKKLTATDLNQTSTRTIHYVSGLNGAPVAEDAVQTIYFERTAHLNYLDDGTANVTYDDWQPTSTNSNVYQALTAPLVDNMTPTTRESAAITESEPTTADETVYYFPKTYTVTPGTSVDPDDPSTVKGPLNPGDPMINPDTPTVPNAQVPPAPKGLETTDLMRDVTETIQYVNGVTGEPVTSDSITGPVTTTLTLKRTAHVTYGSDGKATVTYDAWVPVTFNAVTSPTDVTNMFPVEKEVASVTVATPDQTDYQYVVHYYPTEVTVMPGTPDTPADPNDPNPVDGPLTPGDPLFPDNGNTDTPVVPTGVTDADLLRTVTETVRYVDGNTGEPLTDVTPYTTDVTLSRKAHIHYDQDGNPSVTYGAWTPETFATVTSPDVKHYIAGMTVVPEFTVTDPTNLSLVVNYYPDT